MGGVFSVAAHLDHEHLSQQILQHLVLPRDRRVFEQLGDEAPALLHGVTIVHVRHALLAQRPQAAHQVQQDAAEAPDVDRQACKITAHA